MSMSDEVTIAHPDLPGQEVTVTEGRARVLAKSGWVRAEPKPEPKAVKPTVPAVPAESKES